MPNTPRLQWPYPREDEDPFYATYEASMGAMDYSNYGTQEDRNLILTGGGTVSWTAPTLTWSDAFGIYNPTTGFYTTIAAGNCSLDASGKVAYVTLTRGQSDNVTATMSTGVSVTPEDCYVVALRVNTGLMLRGGNALASGDTFSFVQYSTLPRERGGTGLSVAGTAGYVLTSDGTDWESAPISLVRQTITGDLTITNDLPRIVRVGGISANTAINLPAASDGQIIQVVSGAEAQTYLVQIDANGAETIALSDGVSSGKIYLSAKGGTVTLSGVSGVGWYVTSGSGYGIDPREYGAPFMWFDARRKVTLAASSRLVTTWGDLSLNGYDLTAAGADRPTLLNNTPSTPALVFLTQYLSRANVSWSASNATIFIAYSSDYPSMIAAKGIFGHNVSINTGLGVYAIQATAEDWLDSDYVAFGNGYDSPQNPRTVNYIPTIGQGGNGFSPHVLAIRLGSTVSDMYLDGEILDSRVTNATAITAITNQTFELGRIGADYMEALMSSFIIYPTSLTTDQVKALSKDMLRQLGGV